MAFIVNEKFLTPPRQKKKMNVKNDYPLSTFACALLHVNNHTNIHFIVTLS